jgi:hypothetical protein
MCSPNNASKVNLYTYIPLGLTPAIWTSHQGCNDATLSAAKRLVILIMNDIMPLQAHPRHALCF